MPACQVPTSVVVTLVYNVPKFFELRIEDGDVLTTDMRNNALYSSLYVFWSKLILFEVIPYVTIMLCNILIVAKVQKASRWESMTRQWSRGDIQFNPQFVRSTA